MPTQCLLFVMNILFICIIIQLTKENRRILKNSLRTERVLQTEKRWRENISRGSSITDFLIKNNYNTISVYGIGYMGKVFVDENKNAINIKYIVDKNSSIKNYNGIPVIRPSDIQTADKDIIIITAVQFYDEILEDLYNLGYKMDSIISLDDILWSS